MAWAERNLRAPGNSVVVYGDQEIRLTLQRHQVSNVATVIGIARDEIRRQSEAL